MLLDDILSALFPGGCDVNSAGNPLAGSGILPGYGPVHLLGATKGLAIGVDEAITLAGCVLDIARTGDRTPILFLLDSASQRMSRRDELLGLNEYLAHLAKTLLQAEAEGHRTIGLIYGGSAAGAFIATALATGTLVALPGAHPSVMDLPSMARVTKLPIDVLKTRAEATPVFAPGLDNLVQTGGVHVVLDPNVSLAAQLSAILALPAVDDQRDRLGAERNGRSKAAAVAQRVVSLAIDGHG